MVVAGFWMLAGRPPALRSVNLIASPGAALNQSATVVLAATALDLDGRNQTANATWTWSVAPEAALRAIPTDRPYELHATAVVAGTIDVTAEAALAGVRARETLHLTVDAVRLTFDALAVAPAGEPVPVSVSAVRPGDGRTVTDYAGTVHFASTDPGLWLPPDYTFLWEDHGTRVFSLTFRTTGPQVLTAADRDAPDVAGSLPVRVDHRPVANFTFEAHPADGRAFTFTSTASDPDGDPLASLAWTFGDGTTESGASVAHTYPGDGPFAVHLTATDAWGLPSVPALRLVANGTVAWFAPLPPDMAIEPGRPFLGSLDFFDLFTPDAPWQEAASHVRVFKMYAGQQEATDSLVSQMIADLDRRGIAIAAEFGALTPPGTCGDGIEGFVGHEETLNALARLASLGGTVRFIAMDEPFAFGSLYDGAGACRWSAERVAYGVKVYIDAVHRVAPDVVVGDVEPIWAGADLAAYEGWLPAFRAVNGYELPFFHMDIDWGRADWPAAAKRLEATARARGIETGIIYNGDWGDTTDASWIGHAEERMAIYEAQNGGRPKDVIFQSWMDKPVYCLPETNAATFTHLIDVYFRNRTALRRDVGPAAPDGTRITSGNLTDATGTPLVGAAVTLTARPQDGPGMYAEYTVTGIVPSGSVEADVAFRVNQECGCVGSADFILYEGRYVEGSETSNRVYNGNFSHGANGWGWWGNGTVGLEPSDRGSGWMLHSVTASTQTLGVNSATFPVTPGAAYTMTIAARIPPSAHGSGYFAVMFLAAQEIRRDLIPFAPATLALGTMITDATGAFHGTMPGLPPFTFLVEATYAGDERFWPAYADATVAP